MFEQMKMDMMQELLFVEDNFLNVLTTIKEIIIVPILLSDFRNGKKFLHPHANDSHSKEHIISRLSSSLQSMG